MSMQPETARVLLALRDHCSEQEVRHAFRLRVRELRPDLPGMVDGQVVVDLQQARQTLLAIAQQDRGRGATWTAPDGQRERPYRRDTWGLEVVIPPVRDLRI